MEFIHKMKKREFIEMSLKTVAAVLALFLAVILMEGMIYGIKLNALLTKSSSILKQSDFTVAYCIEQDDDEYAIVYYNEQVPSKWCAESRTYSLEYIKSTEFTQDVKKVVMHAPTAFQLTITPTHYIVISIVTSLLAGFFVYKFIKLSKEYKRIEENYRKTGTIEIG